MPDGPVTTAASTGNRGASGVAPVHRRNPFLAAALSALLPGLGQMYNGERAKAVAVLCISAGTIVIAAVSVAWGLATTHSALNVGIIPAYLLVGLPAITDAWRIASGGEQTSLLGRGSKIYVLMLISVTGPLAL